MKIAFLGPEGSYSHLAAKAFLKTESHGGANISDWDECIPFRNFPEVLNAVSLGRVDAAAIPIENSLQGGVLQNLDLLQAAEDLYAVKETIVRIDNRLVYNADQLPVLPEASASAMRVMSLYDNEIEVDIFNVELKPFYEQICY